MLFTLACPSNCESCYLDVTAKCLMSGCKQGYARKSDGTCAGESMPVCSMEKYLLFIRTCIRECVRAYFSATMCVVVQTLIYVNIKMTK